MDRDFEELKLLFDYTQWQFVPSPLIVATVGAAAVGSSDYHLNVAQWPMWVAHHSGDSGSFLGRSCCLKYSRFSPRMIYKLWEKSLVQFGNSWWQNTGSGCNMALFSGIIVCTYRADPWRLESDDDLPSKICNL